MQFVSGLNNVAMSLSSEVGLFCSGHLDAAVKAVELLRKINLEHNNLD